jgi:hypothetical protein
MKDSLRDLSRSSAVRVAAFVGLVLGVLSVPGLASADPISDAFASGQASLLTYVGLGIVAIVALLLLGIGVGILVKYLRKARAAA